MEQNFKTQKYREHLQESVKDWKFWAKLLIGSTQLFSIVVFLVVSAGIEGNIYSIPEHLSYFTTLSNVFCGIFFISSAFTHHLEGKGKFNNSEVAKIAVTYITITIIIYNLNQMMMSDAYYFDSWKYLMSFICEHSVVPLLAIIYYLFFYNHEEAKDLKEFSTKWLWYMIAGLVLYLAFFSFIGGLARFLNWKPLFGTIDGSGQPSTFVYPFLDWFHGVGFFKKLAPWFECIVMLTGTLLVAIGIDYTYTFIVLSRSKSHSKGKITNSQAVATKESQMHHLRMRK